ncbi:hypothetical protein DV737_g1774, partial [Chaetothyriales sp. CBS 132003]
MRFLASARRDLNGSIRGRKALRLLDCQDQVQDQVGALIISLSAGNTTAKASRSVFQAVVVPRSNQRTATVVASSSGPSSIADSTEDSNYDTPATSAVPTPPLMAGSAKPSAKPKGATARAMELRQSVHALTTRSASKKRKKADDDSDQDDDRRTLNDAHVRRLIADDDDNNSAIMGRGRRTVPPTRASVRHLIADDDDNNSATMGRGRRAVPPSRASFRRFMSPARQSDQGELVHQDGESSFDSDLTSLSDSDSAPNAPVPGHPDLDTGPVIALARSMNRALDRRLRRREAWFRERAQRERKKLEKAHPEIKTMWDDLEAVQPIVPVAAAQPANITRKLKPFQREGLDWMQKQEQSQWRGGLLGDEMGMGKTIQAVSLIMSDYPATLPTLVVVPPVALMQWQAEIKSYTDGKLSVLVYHVSANPKCKNMTLKEIHKYDVIMVSYSGLESMYRKESKGWNRGGGLVKEDSLLHAIHYHRIILDEAHSIKQRTTGVAKACFALKSNYKWCLSGTPVQNRIGEFFSLLRFLEIEPFSCYFCKVCPCKQLHWSQDESKMCTQCKHSGFNHVSVFNQEILNPITQGDDINLRQTGLGKLRLITDRIMLRRLKRDHTSSMELPPKDIVIHKEFFGEIERDFSASIMSNSTRKFDTYVAQGVMLNNYANIFGLIMQMRQVANHPDLILRKNAAGGQNVLVCRLCDEPAEDAIRSRCHHEFCRQCAKNYIAAFDGKEEDAECPQCHIPLVIDWDQPEIEQDEENVKKNSIINRIKMEDWTSSTKIEMLVYDLYKLRSRKQTHKSIVFSQFTSMLQLVQWRLQKSGFKTVLLDGSMSPAQRQKSIDYFMDNVDVEVFLVSLKAGGVALNLTEASRVFIVDPWWNPAAEWQSADRCHRIGQRRPCVITRLCIEDSVESRMVLLQEKKANMINGTVNGDQVALDKLTPEDMQFLFRGS